MNHKKTLIHLTVALMAASVLSCNGELTRNASPVELLVTHSQNLSILDIDPTTTDPDCDEDLGTINMQVLAKNSSASSEFNQVRVTRYRVSYRRTDGGTLVPAPFVRAMDTLISVGQTQGSDFTVFELTAFSQAPFAALLPHNGGRDPETGQPTVKMNVIVEVFGETLGGDNVYDATMIPVEFCYACGCS